MLNIEMVYESLKRWEITRTIENYMHKEIKNKQGNAYYHLVQNLVFLIAIKKCKY
jgi:hypothetical protein